MTKPRRAFGLTLLLLLLQLLGVGSGALASADTRAVTDCELATAKGGDMADMADMAGARPEEDAEAERPCGLPWTTPGCTSASACLPVFAIAAAPSRSTALRIPRTAPPAYTAEAPSSPSRAPELPPPRV